MVKVGMFNHQISRTLGSRARMTHVRNNIAALRGSPYAPYEQDRLNMEVKQLAGLADELDRNEDGRVSLWERGTSVVTLPIRALLYTSDEVDPTYEEYLSLQEGAMGDMNESQSGRIEMLNKAVQDRQRLIGNYELVLQQYNAQVKVIKDTENEQHTELKNFIEYMKTKLQDPTDDVTFDGQTYQEALAKYQREAAVITEAKSNVDTLGEQLRTLQGQIEAQDKAVKDAAVVAGVDVESGALEATGDAIGGFIGPFIIGGIGATLLLGAIAGMRGRTPPRRGRRGSAMDVFMSR
tara:strand:+ start:1877 stop:2758 length:882 start_codon:yes stop_codon:yes gene_type:complete